MADPLQPAETVAPSQGPATATAPVAAPEPAAAPGPSSSEPAPAAAPAPETAPAPAETPAPAAEPAPAEVAKAADANGTLLGDAKTTEAKPAEAPKTDAAPEVVPEAVVLPTFEKFTLPEGVTLEDSKVGDFQKILGEFETGNKADHGQMQAFGQKMVDFYISEAKDAAERMTKGQVDAWTRQQEAWKETFRSDPEIGGNRQETTLRQAAAVMERYGSVAGAEREKALRDAFKATGAGNHPAMIHFFNWASHYTVEGAVPVPASVPKPLPQSRATRRYGNNGA